LAEYRLDELARVSGVSARNIRAYRERGLLDPPRRQGRSAYYSDYHLAQLETIKQLLRKGFTSVHIAQFFASMREGADLADILGLQRAVMGPRSEPPGAPPTEQPGVRAVTLDLDPASDEVRRLVALGLADQGPEGVSLTEPTIRKIVARAADQLFYVRVILCIVESTRDSIDALATEVVRTLEECITSRFGPNYVPQPDRVSELSQIVEDYRDLADQVVADHLDQATRHRMVTAVSGYTVGMLLSGQWEPRRSRG
jgi:DNA-binding transcriptional MerR regulator